MNKFFLFFLFLICCSVVSANNETNETFNDTPTAIESGEYRNLEMIETNYEVENVTVYENCTNPVTNETENCSLGIKTIHTRDVLITQPDYKNSDEELLPYEEIDFDSWNEEEVKPIETSNEENVISPQVESENKDMNVTFTLVFLFFLVTFLVVFQLRRLRKLEKRLEKQRTPEAKVKKLIELGYPDEYCEYVYDKMKEKENGTM